MSKITYTNKVALNINQDVADVNKCNATDLNEIKQVVNENDDDFNTLNANVGDITQLNTTDKTSIVNAINEVNQNDINKGTYSTTEQKIGIWLDGKPVYKKTIVVNSLTGSAAFYTDTSIDNIVNIYGLATYSNNDKNKHQLGAYANTNFYSLIQWASNESKLYYYGNGYNGQKAWVTIEYTKKTD